MIDAAFEYIDRHQYLKSVVSKINTIAIYHIIYLLIIDLDRFKYATESVPAVIRSLERKKRLLGGSKWNRESITWPIYSSQGKYYQGGNFRCNF